MQPTTFIHVQAEDFDLPRHYSQLRQSPGGAVCLFTGLVRDLPQGGLHALEIEHFPAMAEKQLATIAHQACQRWQLHAIHLVHRFGKLKPGEQIVLVGTVSDHREAAFDACRFVMDYLKTDAPFWKKLHHQHGSEWIEANNADKQKRESW